MNDAAYDLLLMDCQMPDLDGYQTTRELRQRETGDRHTKVVALTASAMEGDRERCLEAGVDDSLAKPIDLISLAEALQRRAPKPDTPALATPPLRTG